MTTATPSPMAMPATWDLVASAYAAEVTPMFERYSEEALDRLELSSQSRMVDVATGPGTLAVLAASRVAHVDALDFSPDMLAALRDRLAKAGIRNVTVHQGDGMALPFEDQSYDAATSMFGLFMFSDRARGFSELRRVLRDGGRAAVSSWLPFERAPMLDTLFVVLRELMPGLPFGDAEAPLGTRDGFAREMTAAGFRDVDIREVVHAMPASSTDDFVGMLERTCAPLALLSHKLGDGWGPIRAKLRDKLVDRVGHGPHQVEMPAWLGTGVR